MLTATLLARFIQNDLNGILKRKGYSLEGCPVSPKDLAYMLDLMQEGHLDRKDVKLWCMERCDAYTRAIDLVTGFIREKLEIDKGYAKHA